MLFYGIIQLIPGDFNNHNLLDKANHGCKGQEDRMQTEERLPFLWGVNYYTDSFTLKIVHLIIVSCLIIAPLCTSLMPFITSL